MENPLFEKILFPTDLSGYAIKSLDCIADLPGVREVILLHVVDATTYSKRGWTHEGEIENSRLLLEQHKKDLENLGLAVRVEVDVITSGSVPNRILDVAAAEKVSIIVMGARGRGVVQGLLLGSVSSAVLHNTNNHVLIIRHKVIQGTQGLQFEKFCSQILSRIIFPMDFTEEAYAGLETIGAIPGVGAIFTLYVISRGETRDEIAADEQRANQLLADLHAREALRDCDLTYLVRVGSPIDEIIRVAEEEDASLICMTSHGKGFFRELLVGSTSFDIVRRAKRPVLVLHMTRKEPRD
jgi:nucleotide-binding universal stress UspA family protein